MPAAERSDCAAGPRMRAEHRKSSKPAMERRRRQRINQSLSDLKALILDSLKKTDNSRQSSKLEKADILEMTVRHLQGLQHNQSLQSAAADSNLHGPSKYRAGYGECIHTTWRFLSQCPGVSDITLQKLVTHLEESMAPAHVPAASSVYGGLRHPPTSLPAHQQGGPQQAEVSLRKLLQPSPSPPSTLVPQLAVAYGGFQTAPAELVCGGSGYSGKPLLQFSYHPTGDHLLPNRPLDYSLNFSNSGKNFRHSLSPDSSRSNCSESENVWRPW